MKTCLVVTLTCPDRPGIVDRITKVIADSSANWEESRMAHLGGEFAGIVKLSVPEHEAEAVAAALRALADEEMTVAVKITHPEASAPTAGYFLRELRLKGADHEGIVHKVAHYLAEHGINVETMETEVIPAPISAIPLFQMTAQIKVPPGVSLSELAENLELIGHELGVDIEVAPIRA